MSKTADALDWKVQQSFGNNVGMEDMVDGNHITAVDFDETGTFLAAGDRSGRITIYEQNSVTSPTSSSRGFFSKSKMTTEYSVHGEFQSHDAEFDYLKSLEIEEKINKIKWVKQSSSAKQLLSTNDKTIKLWKIHEKSHQSVSSKNIVSGTEMGSVRSVTIPSLIVSETTFQATPRRVYANAHTYHINSISTNSDGLLYLSADDLRINLWDINDSTTTFNIVDIKPDNMEDLAEVITSSEFHPIQCNTFMYSTSGGSIRLGDMRGSAICDVHSKMFAEDDDSAGKSFFSEIISSISDVKFTSDGRHIIARDYLTLKVWDIRSESRPIKTINIHEHLRAKLCDLYENDCIFDKFETAISGDGQSFATGSYGNYFHVYDMYSDHDRVIEVVKSKPRLSKGLMGRRKEKKDINVDMIDFSQKIIQLAWHPRQNTIAVASMNNLYICNAIG